MAEPKKKSGSPSPAAKPQAEGSAVPSPLSGLLPREELDTLSTLQLIDLIVSKLPQRHPAILDMVYLRERIASIEETNDDARQAIEKMDAIIEKLRSPAFRVGTLLMPIQPDQGHVCVAGTDYVCRVDPQLPLASLQVGQRVLLNEAFAIVQGLGFDRNGPIVRIDELLSDGRLRIGQESGLMPLVLQRSALLSKEKLKPGLDVRLDVNQRVALEVIGLFKRFEHTVPKGFLLYGPPGCGKTLLGKATAYNLRQQVKAQSGVDRPEFFLHVKGPEILNMWVGESERQVRDLFAQCRERANDGALAFLFIDEAESILGTRHGGRFHTMASTLVPMFCTEMDGLEPLQNVVVILASNRADLIDPAILRPGRIDRKVKVKRPDAAGAQSIYEIYLRDSLPLAEPKLELARSLGQLHYARTEENQFLEVIYRSGGGACQEPGYQAFDPDEAGNEIDPGRPAHGLAARISGERFVPFDRHYRRLAEA